MIETKIIVTFRVTIYEAWTTNLTESSSDYFVAMAELYVQFFMPALKTISKVNVSSTTDIEFSTCLVSSFTQSSYSRKRRTADSKIYIDAYFEVIYDILTDADSSTASGMTTSAQEAITSEIETSIETALQELVGFSDKDNHTAGETNFITRPQVTKTEFENEILAAEVKFFKFKTTNNTVIDFNF